MIVWLTPRAMARRASGSWTLRSVWLRVAPSDRPPRRSSRARPGSPSDVIRIAAGIA